MFTLFLSPSSLEPMKVPIENRNCSIQMVLVGRSDGLALDGTQLCGDFAGGHLAFTEFKDLVSKSRAV